MKRFALIFLLAGCQATETIPPMPVDTAFVEFGNSGSITGGGLVTRVFPNDQVYRSYRSTVPGKSRTEWHQLADGAFQDIKSLALTQFQTLPATDLDAPCLDAGTDRVVIVDFDNVRSAYGNTCPSDAASAVFAKLRAEVSRQIEIAEDQGL